jgi:aspartyl-tRNA(Asn)/glutamyl-tRNA(Gln) amidotransferase subunit A
MAVADKVIQDDPEAIAFSDLAALTARFKTGLLTPVEATDLCLERIARLNPALNAFLHLDPDGAREAARQSAARWAAGRPLSPIDGVPIGIKANIAVAGLPWHAGVGAYRDRIAEQDADCVAALRAAGAVMLGVLNMHEAALGATTDNLAFGRCHNPWRQGFTPGGSSGGSGAAVAAGLCVLALGTDTLGSVRIPASYCGVFGHIPAHGEASVDGVIPLSWTLDRLGVLARSARDIEAVMPLLAARREPPAALGASAETTVGVLDLSGWPPLDDAVAAAFERLVKDTPSAGVRLTSVKLGGYQAATLLRAALLVVEVEAFVIHEAALAADPDGFSPTLTAMLRWAERQLAPKLAAAYRDLARAGDRLRSALSGLDGLLLPTTATPAFDFDAAAPAGQADFTLPANLAGLAATAFPIGPGPSGLPLSAQVIGARGETTLSLAARLAVPFAPPPGMAG